MAAVTLRRTREATIAGQLVMAARAAASGLVRWGPRARSLLLTSGGLGSLVAAAWLVAVPLGLLVAGVSLLVLEYLSADGRPSRSHHSRRSDTGRYAGYTRVGAQLDEETPVRRFTCLTSRFVHWS
jgi:hypothetical protein